MTTETIPGGQRVTPPDGIRKPDPPMAPPYHRRAADLARRYSFTIDLRELDEADARKFSREYCEKSDLPKTRAELEAVLAAVFGMGGAASIKRYAMWRECMDVPATLEPIPEAVEQSHKNVLETVRSRALVALEEAHGKSDHMDISVVARCAFGGVCNWTIVAKHPIWDHPIQLVEPSANEVLNRFYTYIWEIAPVHPVLDLEKH